MHSIRTKITVVTVGVVVVAMIVATAFCVVAIRNINSESADQQLLLLCETGQKNLNHYFDSVEQSVEMVSAYVESDLDGVSDDELQTHLERVNDIFKKLTYKTFGVLTYYYRIDPKVSKKATGFWYVNLDGNGFREHEPTDISKYDTNDTSKLVWFTVPKATGEGVWLPPYITDNLGVRVISYNVPVYYKEKFIGVIGIEIDYTMMADEVNHINLYDNGYAFLNDAKGNIIYHPEIDVTKIKKQPKVPDGLLGDDKSVRYTYGGVEKRAVWLPLNNGMRLNVSVPEEEINEEGNSWSNKMILILSLLLIAFIVIITIFTKRLTKPLKDLTVAAEKIDEGVYDCELDYDGNDEIGILTRTFKKVTSHLKIYINDLNDLAYADALTSLHNKGAFYIYINGIQEKIDENDESLGFAVCIFDCNSLKEINDTYGHEKGDIYLKQSSKTICDVFAHSPAFRIGGDEFAVILQNTDYENRDELLRTFDEKCAEKCSSENDPWNKVDVARGMAVYDPEEDSNVNDVVRRADKIMYENKMQSDNRDQR